jgi:hypothetical protein
MLQRTARKRGKVQPGPGEVAAAVGAASSSSTQKGVPGACPRGQARQITTIRQATRAGTTGNEH